MYWNILTDCLFCTGISLLTAYFVHHTPKAFLGYLLKRKAHGAKTTHATKVKEGRKEEWMDGRKEGRVRQERKKEGRLRY